MTASSRSRGNRPPMRSEPPRRLPPQRDRAHDVGATTDLRLVLPAVPESLRQARDELIAWLAELGWPADGVVDLILAVNEAVANAVDHAYPAADPGPVGLHGRCGPGAAQATRRVTITVTDRGDWRREHRAVGHRGNGLALIRACTAETRLLRSARGTTVILVSNDVPTSRGHRDEP